MSGIRSGFVLVVIIGIVIGGYLGIKSVNANTNDDNVSALEDNNENRSAAKEEEEQFSIGDLENDRINILLMGTDAREGWESSRSDTMILASIDPELDRAVLISIPRDTRTQVRGRGTDKICTARFSGGPELAVTTVENLLGLKIDNYVEIDFEGFAGIIDTLGGISMDVPQRMYYPAEGINLQAGQQKLNGKQALAFVRFRGYPEGDIKRIQYQQKFIMSAADQLCQTGNITKLPSVIKQAREYTNTDLGMMDMLKIGKWALQLDRDAINTQVLPGYYYDQRDEDDYLLMSYWIADADGNVLLNRLFAGEQLPVVTRASVVEYIPGEPEENDEMNEKDTADPTDENGIQDEDKQLIDDNDGIDDIVTEPVPSDDTDDMDTAAPVSDEQNPEPGADEANAEDEDGKVEDKEADGVLNNEEAIDEKNEDTVSDADEAKETDAANISELVPDDHDAFPETGELSSDSADN